MYSLQIKTNPRYDRKKAMPVALDPRKYPHAYAPAGVYTRACVLRAPTWDALTHVFADAHLVHLRGARWRGCGGAAARAF